MNLHEDNVFARRLLSIADGTYEETAAKLAGEDLAHIAHASIIEVATRTRILPPLSRPVTVAFELFIGEARLDYRATLGAKDAEVHSGSIDDPWLTVRQDLIEFLRSIYGPPGPPHDATRTITAKDSMAGQAGVGWKPLKHLLLGETLTTVMRSAASAAYQITTACSPQRHDLNALAVAFGSDKWGSHWYTEHYARHFEPFREQRVTVLELGIGGYNSPDSGGGSLQMWRSYFRRGMIFGLDYFDKSGLIGPRIETVRGDQSDRGLMDSIGRQIGPLDIVIDDGSHISAHVIASFEALFPHVRPGGLYVIEDTQTSYWSGWGGNSERSNHATTTMGYVKHLADVLHYREWERPEPYEPTEIERWIRAIHVYHNIVFIEKGINLEQTAPPWILRDSNPMQ